MLVCDFEYRKDSIIVQRVYPRFALTLYCDQSAECKTSKIVGDVRLLQFELIDDLGDARAPFLTQKM